MPDGKLKVQWPLPKFDDLMLDGARWESTLKIFGKQLAMYFFARLLDSPYSYHIARCDGCGRIFAYDRLPSKRPISRGVFCKNCQSDASLVRVRESRKQQKKPMIETAAEALMAWAPTHRHGALKEWVVQEVNAKLPSGRKPININWVTLHQTKIEAEVERRKRAKS